MGARLASFINLENLGFAKWQTWVLLAILGLSFIAYVFYQSRVLKRDLHMMQQNSYLNDRFSRWLKPRLNQYILKRNFIPLIAPVFLLLGQIPFVIVLLIYALFAFTYKRPVEKLPLAMTKRAKRLYSVSIIIAIIWGLIGLALMFTVKFGLVLGTVWLVLGNVFSFMIMKIAAAIMKPIEKKINMSFFKDAQKIITSMPWLNVIGITGSYGKTSTKFILGRILIEQYHALVTPDSYNTPMGVTITIRNMLKPVHEVFVTEMGARQSGDIKELCDLTHPKIGILTAIGPQHLETFKTLDNIIKTKFELINSLPADGKAILNFDDENIKNYALNNVKVPMVTYGLHTPEVDFSASNLSFSPAGTSFTVHNRGKEYQFQTRLLGEHNVANILAGIATARTLGMSFKEISKGVKGIEPVPHRLNLKINPQGINIIDDAFNSNPVGSEMAIDILAKMPGGRKILITPGMVELGSKQYELNKKFAMSAANKCDYIILVGRKHTEPMQEGLREAMFPADRWYVADDLTDANDKMRGLVLQGDYVLYENDLPDTYNE